MPRKQVNLAAGARTRIPTPGKMLQIMGTGAAAGVALSVVHKGGSQEEDLGTVATKFKYKAEDKANGIEAVYATSTVATTLDLLHSDNDVSAEQGTTVATIDPASFPLQVVDRSTGQGTNPGVAAIAAAESLVVGGSVLLKRVTFYNAGANAVAIYRVSGTTFPAAGIILAPGATFIEERFAGNGQGFYARCNAGLASSLGVETFA